MRIQMVPHDPQWAVMFVAARELIQAAMGENLVALHHIGSTSVPNIYAKPVIDMLAVVRSIAVLDSSEAAIQALGYEAKGEFGIAGRRYFRKDDAEGNRTHQIHAFGAGSPHIERHFAFRDYLIAHPQVAAEYSRLKQSLAAAHADDIEAYMDGKDPFIKEHERRAIEWAKRGSRW